MKKKRYDSKIKPFSPVLVRWRDPASHHGWRPESFIKEQTSISFGMPCESVGMLVSKNDQGIVICLSAASKLPEDDLGETLEIPKGCVDEVYLLE